MHPQHLSLRADSFPLTATCKEPTWFFAETPIALFLEPNETTDLKGRRDCSGRCWRQTDRIPSGSRAPPLSSPPPPPSPPGTARLSHQHHRSRPRTPTGRHPVPIRPPPTSELPLLKLTNGWTRTATRREPRKGGGPPGAPAPLPSLTGCSGRWTRWPPSRCRRPAPLRCSSSGNPDQSPPPPWPRRRQQTTPRPTRCRHHRRRRRPGPTAGGWVRRGGQPAPPL